MAIPNRGPELLAVDLVFVILAVLANGLRCAVRLKVKKRFGIDDWLMLFATLFFVLYTASSVVGIQSGTGRHHHDLSDGGIQKAKHAWWYCYLCYCTSTILTKVSIGYFLLQIPTKRIHILTIYVAMGATVLAGITFFFVATFQCQPVTYFWDKDQTGTCVDMTVVIALVFVYSVCSIITDFTFAILPAFIIWNLQMKRGTKIAVIPLLTMGVIASGAVIARLPYVVNIGSPDFLWATLDIAIWSTVEQGLGITAGSLAAVRPLFQALTRRFGESTQPVEPRASNYGRLTFGTSDAMGSRRKQSQNDPAMYEMSIVAGTRCSDEESLRKKADSYRSPVWSSHSNNETSRHSVELASPPGYAHGNDSGHVVKDNKKGGKQDGWDAQWKSSQSSSNEGMQIMVERTFHVTDEERKSAVLRGGKF